MDKIVYKKLTQEMFDEAVKQLEEEHNKKDRTMVLYYKGYIISGPFMEVLHTIGKEPNAKN